MQETENYSEIKLDEYNGVSNEGIDKLMLDVIDYADKMNKVLNQIADLINDTEVYFSCESGDKFRDQFNMLKVSNPIINKNILSYNDDYMNVKKNYQERANKSVEILNAGEQDVASRI